MILDVDPKVDYAFKFVFGRESTRPVLADVLDKVRNPPPGGHVGELDLLNPFNSKETLDDKLSILDVKARDESGRQFNVEMQMLAHRHYDKRILYYWAKFHQQQLHEGQDYFELRPTISISFLNHVLFPDVPGYHLIFWLLEQTHGFALNDVEVHVLELPKFTKSAAECSSGLDAWLYFLRHAEKMDTDALPQVMQQPMILRAVEELKMLSLTKEDRDRYEARRLAQLDYNTGMKAVLEGEEKGRLEGEEKGRLVGREEGRLIGVIQLSERLLRRPQTPTEALAQRPLEELARLADDLQAKVVEQTKLT